MDQKHRNILDTEYQKILKNFKDNSYSYSSHLNDFPFLLNLACDYCLNNNDHGNEYFCHRNQIDI